MSDINSSKTTNNEEETNKTKTCIFPDCNSCLKNPIILPCCESTICQEHVQKISNSHDNLYKCKNCMIVKKLSEKLLDKNQSDSIHFSQLQKNTISKLDILNSSKADHNSFMVGYWQSEYFFDLRNKVDIHREELIQNIHRQSDKIIKKLNELEESVNNVELPKKDLSNIESEMNFWEKRLKEKQLDEDKLNELNKKFQDYTDNIKDDISKLKYESINHTYIEFIPNFQTDSFGELIIKKLAPDFGVLTKSFSFPPDIIRSFLITDEMLITSHETQIRIWNSTTYRFLRSLPGYDEYNSLIGRIDYTGKETNMLVAPNFRLIISNGLDKRCKIYDLNRYHCTDILTNKSGVKCMCLLSDDILACGLADGSINVWYLKSNKLENINAFNNGIRFLKLTNDSTQLVSYSAENEIKLWSLTENFKLTNTISIMSKIISFDLYSTESFLIGCADQTLKSLNLETGKCLELIKFQLGNWITCIQTINSQLIAAALANGILIVYDLKENFLVKNFSIFPDHIIQMKIISDGQLMALSNRGHMNIIKFLEMANQDI